jgi:4-hydroxy-L-threonine phosphate dehydrogenase PdxA
MMFISPALNVTLATAHIPLAAVPTSLTQDHILRAATVANATLIALGTPAPRVAVCGLNPHAGEDGLLGDEDRLIIAPAIARLRDLGINASGPHPADTVFAHALAGPHRRHDLVVAMYHDQGLIPLKLIARDHAVNVTAGLPVPRTSPDHGTAFDIAGRNLADPGSMKAACLLAASLAAARA